MHICLLKNILNLQYNYYYNIENIGGLGTSRSSRSISAAVAPPPSAAVATPPSAAVAPPPPAAVAPPPSAAIDPAGEDDPPCVGVGVGDGFRLGVGGGAAGAGRLVQNMAAPHFAAAAVAALPFAVAHSALRTKLPQCNPGPNRIRVGSQSCRILFLRS
jgi:hypothetical protein